MHWWIGHNVIIQFLAINQNFKTQLITKEEIIQTEFSPDVKLSQVTGKQQWI